AVQASNGTLTSSDRSSIQDEVDQLKAEVNQISSSTEFNTKKLLNGNGSGIWSTDSGSVLSATLTGQVREGNYRINVTASAVGTNEVWKSDVMELKNPYTATANDLRVQLNNTSGSMLTTGNITVTQTKVPQDTAYYYQFQQGKAAELNGSAVGVGAITIAGTDASFAAKSSEQRQMGATQQVAGVAQNCSTETVNFNQSTTLHFGANAVTFGKGTYNMTQITCAIETGGGGVKVLWTAGTTPNPAGGYFMTISSTAGVAISVTGDTGALNLANTTLAANTSVTAGQNTENSYLFFFTGTGTVAANGGFTSFNINANGHSATVSFKANGTNQAIGAGGNPVIAINEADVLSTINNKLMSAQLGVRAQVDINHQLSFVVTSADGSVKPSSFVISNLVHTANGYSVSSLGITAGTHTGSGNDKIVFSVNHSSVYTATLKDAVYSASATGRQKLAAALQSAMNTAVLAGGGSTSNLVNVAYSGNSGGGTVANGAFNLISQKIGGTSQVQLYDGAGLASVLSAVGWDLTTLAQGNDNGVSLAIYKDAAKTELATQIYNRRTGSAETTVNYSDWSAAGNVALATSITADATMAASGVQLHFTRSTAATVGNAGSLLLDVTKIGDQVSIAKGSNTLGQIAQFNGLLDQSRNLNIYANGQKATIYFDKATTLNQLQNMIASAITTKVSSGGLGLTVNGTAAGTVYNHVADFITNTSEGTYRQGSGDAAVDGTLVVRSPWAGASGQLFFGADEDLQTAFSFARIQCASDTQGIDPWLVQVTDAHTGQNLFDRKVASPEADNLIPGVDIKFSPTVGVNTTWNANTGSFDFASDGQAHSMVLHVVDKHVNLAVGANAGQNISTSIGEVDTASLGLDNVLMVDPTLAQRSISKIDHAINMVSSQRSKLGAVMNRLDYTVNNLSVMSQNMTAAESSITDLDMAQGVAAMTKYQIMNQAGTAMLAQANQLPQSLLTLLR
ncbi:MAG: hypothetical protein HQK57_08290, partial [Deltaproteobacteria bacterium]|nr:hypothetical protein [Deltaproteobacteria bacterium]